MSLILYRRATDDDAERLDHSARRFAARHSLPVHWDEPDEDYRARPDWVVLESYLWDMDIRDAGALRRLWLACFRRAVRNGRADTIAYGMVCRSMHTS